jgi:hypothetical protein
MKRLRNLGKSIRGAFSGEMMPVHGIATGTMAVTLGCTACQFRQTVDIPGVGGVKIDLQPLVPVAVEFNDQLKTHLVTVELNGGVGINQTPCEDAATGCPYGVSVNSLAENLRAHPNVLEAVVMPPVQEF